MARGKTLIKQSQVTRAARGLLAAMAATGVHGDIEVHLETGILKLHVTDESDAAAPSPVNEWDTVK